MISKQNEEEMLCASVTHNIADWASAVTLAADNKICSHHDEAQHWWHGLSAERVVNEQCSATFTSPRVCFQRDQSGDEATISSLFHMISARDSFRHRQKRTSFGTRCGQLMYTK